MTFGGGRLWACVGDADNLVRIDPQTTGVVTMAGPRDPAGLAVAGGHVFVASNTRHRVAVLDPARPRRRPLAAMRVPLNPYAMAAGAGHVWVTGIASDTLTRIAY